MTFIQNMVNNRNVVTSQTANNSSSLIFKNLPANPNIILITFSGVQSSVGASVLRMQLSTNQGSSFITSGYLGGITYTAYNSNATSNQSTSTGFLLAPLTSSGNFEGHQYVYNFNDSTNIPIGNGLVTVWDTTNIYTGFASNGLPGTTGVNAFSISFTTGNIATGTFNLQIIK